MNDPDFMELEKAAVDSMVGLSLNWVLDRSAAALRDSRVARSLSSIATTVDSMRLEDRLRYALLVSAAASIGYAVLLSFIPAYVATGIPRAWFYGLGLLFLMASAAARPLAAALPGSALAKFWRWLVL